MRTILVIGIGAGNPDYLTLQAIKAMNRAEVFFMPDKGEEKAGRVHAEADRIAAKQPGAPPYAKFWRL